MIISCIVVLSYLKKTKVYKTRKVTNYFSIYVQLMRLMKAKQLPMAAITGADPETFDRGRGGGGGPNFGSERTVELFSWQVTSPPHSLPPVAVTQIIGGYPKQLHFSISLEFSLVAKCNARFIKKISQFKRNIRSCRCKNFSLKQASGLIEGAERGGGGGGMIRHCIAWVIKTIKTTRTTLLVRTEFYGEYRPQHATQSTGQVYANTWLCECVRSTVLRLGSVCLLAILGLFTDHIYHSNCTYLKLLL